MLTNLRRVPARAHPRQIQGVSERQQMIDLAPLEPAQIGGRRTLETLSSLQRRDYPSELSRPEDFGKKSALTAGVSSHAWLYARMIRAI